jgi:DNA-binding XRE family transcriptional regulator
MLEHTKKPRIDLFQVTCPANKTHLAKEYLASLGCTITDEAMDASDLLPSLTPAVVLSGVRYRENLTQQQLSQLTGIPRRHLSEMENGKRPIGRTNAKRLGQALGVDTRLFFAVS